MESEIIIKEKIHGLLVTPEEVKGKIPAVLLFHGFGTDKNEVGNIFETFANQLAASGIASLRIDFSGFGQSSIESSQVTLDNMIDDANDAYDYLAHLDFIDKERIGACGFSLGAGITVMLASTNKAPLKSIILLAPAGNLIEDFKTHIDESVVNDALQAGPEELIEIKFDWRDKLVMSPAFFKNLRDHDLKSKISQFKGAFFAVAGTDDFTCAHAMDYHDKVNSADKKLWLIAKANHVFNFGDDSWELGQYVVEKCTEQFTRTL